jgi:16S rRNA C967 or C1407 C5-methylase (RsmB/RsmF family)
MGAAPGSKTTQLMEMMHEDTPNPCEFSSIIYLFPI